MADTVLQQILMELLAAKYYSISVDSTPDVSHVDQLTFIVRYVNTNGLPVERLLKFIPNSEHIEIGLKNSIMKIHEGH